MQNLQTEQESIKTIIKSAAQREAFSEMFDEVSNLPSALSHKKTKLVNLYLKDIVRITNVRSIAAEQSGRLKDDILQDGLLEPLTVQKVSDSGEISNGVIKGCCRLFDLLDIEANHSERFKVLFPDGKVPCYLVDCTDKQAALLRTDHSSQLGLETVYEVIQTMKALIDAGVTNEKQQIIRCYENIIRVFRIKQENRDEIASIKSLHGVGKVYWAIVCKNLKNSVDYMRRILALPDCILDTYRYQSDKHYGVISPKLPSYAKEASEVLTFKRADINNLKSAFESDKTKCQGGEMPAFLKCLDGLVHPVEPSSSSEDVKQKPLTKAELEQIGTSLLCPFSKKLITLCLTKNAKINSEELRLFDFIINDVWNNIRDQQISDLASVTVTVTGKSQTNHTVDDGNLVPEVVS